MAALSRLPSGSWRALVRRKGVLASRNFRLKGDAESWAIAAERSIDTGGAVNSPRIDRNTTFGEAPFARPVHAIPAEMAFEIL